jgi:C4-dicarboxylate-specific signal transduction histidine kinase
LLLYRSGGFAMMEAIRAGLRERTRLLAVALLFIVAGFAASNIVSIAEMRRLQAANRGVIENAILSVEDVSHLVRDIDQKRLLVDAHIFEKAAQDMEILERRIAEVDADVERTSRLYEQLATFPGEHEKWAELRFTLASLRQPIEHVLTLSRQDRDVEARAAMAGIEPALDAVSRDADRLIQLNRDASDRAVEVMHSVQDRATLMFGGITATGALLALSIAAWVLRTTRRQDEQIRADAILLESRNRELDAFAGRVAHDLRGPLTTISISAASLARHLPQEDRVSEVLRRGVERMEALIRDLLSLSRIDAQAPSVSSEATAVVAEVRGDLAPSVEGVHGVLRVDVEPATVRCSAGLLREALANLGENAIKYRRVEVPLEVEMVGKMEGQYYAFRFSDNGAGMSPEEARRAFEPLFRGAQAQTTPGTGLGLSIVKRVIEASGGTVRIDSELGQGTTFILKLPLGEKASA